MKFGNNGKLFSFSLIRGGDGRWRTSNTKFWFLSRSEAWKAGMAMVRRELDRLQSNRLAHA